MTFRTDLVMNNGKLMAAPSAADKPLPEVKHSDRLMKGWGEALKREAGKLSDDLTLNSALLIHDSMVNTWHALKESRGVRNPNETQAAHLHRLANSTDRAINGLAQKSQSARDSIKARLNDLSIQMDGALGMKDNGQSAELRAVLRNLSDEVRGDMIGKAIKEGDGELLSAGVRGHPLLSGLSVQKMEAYRTQALMSHAPDYLTLERALKKADALLSDTFLDMLSFSDSLTAKNLRDEYQKEEAKALAARDKADQLIKAY